MPTLATVLAALAISVLLITQIRRDARAATGDHLLTLLGMLVTATALALAALDRRRKERPVRAAVFIGTTVMPGPPAVCAVAFSLLAALFTAQGVQPIAAAALWAAALALLLIHAIVLERPRLHPPQPVDAVGLIGLLALAALLRLPYLQEIPSFVHSDEAQMGLHSKVALAGHMPSLFGTTDWWSVPWLGPALQAPVMWVFGQGLLAVRLGSVLAALLVVAGIWFLGSELWSYRAAFVSAMIFAALAPSIHFGRDGAHYMQSIAALVWTVLCYTRATKRYSGAYAALTGILVGVDVQLYYAARLAVPLVLAHACFRAATEKGLLRNWLRILAWTGLGLLVTALPLGAYYLAHPDALSQRTDAVLIFSSTPMVRAALAQDYGAAGWLQILLRQAQQVVLGFLAIGDRSEQYGAPFPLLDPITASLAPVALAVGLARARQAPWFLCVLWLSITAVLGGVLTTQQPDAPRLLAALPALCLLLGGLAHTMLTTAGETGLRDAKPLLALALAGSLVGIAILNTNAYLHAYPPVEAVQPVTLITDVARFLGRQPGGEPVILYDNREFYLAHWTIQLLAPRVTGVTVWTPAGVLTAARAADGHFLLVDVDRGTGMLSRVGRLYPGGTLIAVPIHDPAHTVLAYLHR
jgi:hypothetical protein